MKAAALALALVFVPTLGLAQVAVRPVPDVVSYATAFVSPAVAAVEAWRAPDRACRFSQLAMSEAFGNGLSLTLKHRIVSSRPCFGCAADGFPSGHTMNSAIGFSSHWQFGLTFALATAELRVAANRHTPLQVAAGAAIGVFADGIGRALIRCER